MMTDFFSESGKFARENFIMYDKSEILLNNAESFTHTMNIGVYNCWVHVFYDMTFFKKIPHFWGIF